MSRFWKFATFLKEELPTNRRVAIRLVPMKDDGSTTLSDKGRITVCVNSRLSAERQLDTLIHEWGHVDEFDVMRMHGKSWGYGLSKAYEAWERFREMKE